MYNILYDGKFIETGSRITGHRIINSNEIDPSVFDNGVDKTYGEILPGGVASFMTEVSKILTKKNLIFADLGMGCGKLCIQVFNEYPTIQRVIGVEFYTSRFNIAANTLIKYAELNKKSKKIRPHAYEIGNSRTIRYYNKNLFNMDKSELETMDVILLHICEPKLDKFDNNISLKQLLSSLKKGTLIISYHELISPVLTFIKNIPCEVSWKYRDEHLRKKSYDPCYDLYLYQK